DANKKVKNVGDNTLGFGLEETPTIGRADIEGSKSNVAMNAWPHKQAITKSSEAATVLDISDR
ncbi:hypothetical protein BGZ92_007252, partial [Podila epicladia]